VAAAVREGLGAAPRRLPPWLFYDAEGSRLFEAITRLPEYYLTRVERELLEAHADEIVALAAGDARLHVVELGAGTAEKSQLILAAAVRRQGHTLFLPVDVSGEALEAAVARLARELPAVEVRPLRLHHEAALGEVASLGPRRLVLFIGSSIGNLEDAEAVALLSRVRASLAPGGALLLGADRKKDPAVLLPAYDDAAGVTAAFNLNLLRRLNRELDARFDLGAFRHVALWNEAASRIEMHLESQRPQEVRIEALDLTVRLARGERIHTESSHKYDEATIDRILGEAGFRRERTFTDPGGLFGVHLARAG